MGPVNFEIYYLKLEDKLNQILTRQSVWLRLLATAILTFYIIYSVGEFHDFKNYNRSARHIYHLSYGVYLLITLSLVFHFLSKKINASVLGFSFLTILWIAESHSIFSDLNSFGYKSLVYLYTPLLCLVSYLFLKAQLNPKIKWWKSASLYTLFFVIITTLLVKGLNLENTLLTNFFFKLKIHFLWLICLVWSYKRPFEKSYLDIATNPVNGLRGILWPDNFRKSDPMSKESISLWWRGTLNIFLAYSLLNFPYIYVLNYFVSLFETSYSRIVYGHFQNLFLDIAMFNLIAGAARIFGYRVSDATSFAILSKKPVEYWRRISVYHYIFIFKNVRIPLTRMLAKRNFNNRFFLTLVSFFVFFLNHQTLFLIKQFSAFTGLGGESEVFSSTFLESSLISFFCNFMLIYVTSKYWFVPNNKLNHPFYGWLSILLTHMSLIFVNQLAGIISSFIR